MGQAPERLCAVLTNFVDGRAKHFLRFAAEVAAGSASWLLGARQSWVWPGGRTPRPRWVSLWNTALSVWTLPLI